MRGLFLMGLLAGATLAFGHPAQADCGWRPRQLIQMSGEVTRDGLSGSFRRRVEPASGRFAERIDLAVVASGQGYDGAFAWSQDISGASHRLNSDFARRVAASEAWIARHLSCPKPKSLPGAALLTGSPDLAGWRFTPSRGAPVELWYDVRKGRLDHAVLQYPENRLIRHFADWRDAGGGRMLPFLERDEDPEDGDETVYRISRITVADGKADFAPPPRPSDSRMLRGDSTTVPFEDDHRTRVFVPVYLDGKGPFTFELDNGGHFILTEETAKALGLSSAGDVASTGAGAEVRHGGYVRTHSIRMGEAEMTDQPARVLGLSASANDRGPRPPRAGILGLEFFERFIVGVDHRNRTVTLRLISQPPAAPPPGRPIPLLFDEDAALAAGGYAGVGGNVMLDIGNAGATIVEDAWADAHGLKSQLAAGLPYSSIHVSRGRVGLGPFELQGETIAYYGPVERGSEHTQSIAAVLGEPLLSRFNAVYDYGRGTVWLQPLEDVPPLPFNRAGLLLSKTPTGDFAVAAIMAGSPAETAGLKKDEVIDQVGGQPAPSLSRADAMALFQQTVGATVEMHVRAPQPRSVTLTLRELLD